MNKKAPDYGLRIGKLKSGPLNKISDVNGVKVGHYTLDDGYNNTGVTVIMPTEKNVFIKKQRVFVCSQKTLQCNLLSYPN